MESINPIIEPTNSNISASSGSVFTPILSRANWVSKLQISGQAKRLTLLKGRQFRLAVEKILTTL